MNKKFSLFISILLLSASITINAQMPPHPELLKKIQSGQVPMPYMLKHLDEMRKQGIDAPSPNSIIKVLNEKKLNKALNGGEIQSFNILAVCVDFSDRPFQTDPVIFDTLFFGKNKTNSIYNYLKEATYGKVLITSPDPPSKIGKVLANKTYAYYCGTTHGANMQELVGEIVSKLDPVINYAQYDIDGDKEVDCLFIIHSGTGAERSGKDTDIWSHASGISSQYRDGVYIRPYSTEPEYWDRPGDMTCGVYAHEMGHAVFGLPDLYDINADNGGSNGLGSWSIMAGGSWNGTNGDTPAHFDGWSKARMGVLTPVNITADTTGFVFNPAEDEPAVYKIWRDGKPGKEYFILENRQLKGFDTRLPGRGLLIYHVDDNQSTNGNQWYPGHTNAGHYLVALEQADGLWDLEKGVNNGDTKDPFPGLLNQRTFDFGTSPNTKSYSNSFTNISISNITASQLKITADISLTDALYLSSSSFDLGSAEVPNTLSDSVLSIKNTGLDSIYIASVTNSNPLIRLKSDVVFPLTLYKNETIKINVVFTPVEKGLVQDTVIIKYTGTKQLERRIPLTAFGFIVKPALDSLLYCSTRAGSMMTLNPANGYLQILGKSGFPRVKSLAVQRNNKLLYGLGITSTETDLIKINGVGGDGYKVLKLNKPVSAITFDTAGTLFGTSDFGALYKINTTTGICDSVGNTRFNSSNLITGLAVNPVNNKLYASIGAGTVTSDAIYSLNVLTGAATLIGNTGFKQFTTCIAFDNKGNMFGIKTSATGSGNLIKINPETGAGNLLSTNSYSGIEGLCILNSYPLTGIEDEKTVSPFVYSLEQNYPNPFNPVTSINYSVAKAGVVKIKVFDVLGREISTPVNEAKQPGKYTVQFNAAALSSGVYFYSITTDNYSSVKKMQLLK